MICRFVRRIRVLFIRDCGALGKCIKIRSIIRKTLIRFKTTLRRLAHLHFAHVDRFVFYEGREIDFSLNFNPIAIADSIIQPVFKFVPLDSCIIYHFFGYRRNAEERPVVLFACRVKSIFPRFDYSFGAIWNAKFCVCIRNMMPCFHQFNQRINHLS